MFSINGAGQLGTATRLGVFRHNSPEWHQARGAHRLGGSEIASVLGLSKWESRYSLWHRKKGLVPPQAVNDEMAFGTRAEQLIIDWFAELHPDHYVDDKVGTWTHRDRDWQLANPDAICWRRDQVHAGDSAVSIVEAKVADDEWEWGPKHADGYGDADGVPPYYRAQCLWYLDVLGLDRAYLAVLFLRGRELRVYRIDAHPADQAYMRQHGAEFLADVAAGIVPDLDAHTSTYQAVRELHPDIDARDVQLDGDLAADYVDACEQFDLAQQRRALWTTRVADAMGLARRGLAGDRVIARRQSRADGLPYLVRVQPRAPKEIAA